MRRHSTENKHGHNMLWTPTSVGLEDFSMCVYINDWDSFPCRLGSRVSSNEGVVFVGWVWRVCHVLKWRVIHAGQCLSNCDSSSITSFGGRSIIVV